MEELLLKAQNGDNNAKEEIIKSYYPLIIKECKKVFLKNTSFEDLVQIGILNLLKAINLYDLSRGIQSFPSYVFWSIKNSYASIMRSEIKFNEEVSLNNFCKDSDIELVDSLVDESFNLEESIVQSFSNKEVILAFEKLEPEEKDILSFLYLEREKPNLSKYCCLRNKDYYYCSKLKKRALKKLKKLL